ncbi:MAG: hypothetical protein I3270_01125 [Candidatus Moeniiplasma glomeromycotorum]|nr:hypothetical protein [Candidatus Moeniiplasma glomeromycotorum]MCE8166237.1 hypothetical protein [Candidatus Moeniiplasma glomeromycotorum]MCE8166719.1 hypothetical protein [Candidatus Moeniiplasma glomeromycotorum]
MFQWLKNFLEWPPEGIKNISGLGNYIKLKWWKLLILLVVIFVIIYLIYWLIKLLKTLFK